MDFLNPESLQATFFGQSELPRFACEGIACEGKKKKKCCKKYKKGKGKQCKSCPKR